MTSTRLVVFLTSVGLLLGCVAEEVAPKEGRNPIYGDEGKSAVNPLFEGTMLTVDPGGRPVVVYAEKVIEKAIPGLKDTVKTQVRVVRPDAVGDGAAQPVVGDASPRALGTVKGVVHLLVSASDGTLSSLVVGGGQQAPVPLPGFTAGDFGPVHRPAVNIGGTAFAALQGAGGEYDGQAVLVELNPSSGRPRVLAVGEPLKQLAARFLAHGSDAQPEFAVAFEGATGVHTALSAGGELTSTVETGKAGTPLAVWTDGKLAKTVVDTRAGQLLLLGRESVEVAVSTSALCRAATFSPEGKPYALEVTQTEVKLLDASGTALVTEKETFAEGDFADCAVVVTEREAHLVWRKLRSPPTESRIELDEITYLQEPLNGSTAPRLKTKHDTAKNSISNVR